ncbi:putative inhibitor of apoptosis [Saccostrea echinata]|uniref:putative inhibitor of apoptosis n=1 Tax=Saccostrea echinata TaxID=191078 RepID=UPI002A816A75|nr:putative inhibitor of apoptosis [Saccostrea echinata]
MLKEFPENNNNNDLNTVTISKHRDYTNIDTGTANPCNSYHSSTSTVCPVTELSMYYEECAKNPEMDVSERMKFEIIRYSTFSTLKDCPIAFMKLSKAGFYYDTAAEVITCFQCGYIYSNIQSNDDPMEIHFRNSPNCDFVQKNYDASHLASSEARAESTHYSNSEGASGGPSDIHQSNSYLRGNASQSDQSRTQTEEVLQSSKTENQSVVSENNYPNNTSSSNNISACLTQIPSHSASSHTSGQPKKAKEIFKDLGICVEKPKYPKYSILATRMTSFKNWPISNIVSPEDLSKAGFYYNGLNDTVCCFFCGGKLAEWERGDDPWIEHAHWFPNCEFVKLCKGDSSLNHEQDKKEELMQPEDPFQSIAFQSVMEMGYSKEQIKTVYNKIENRENMSAAQLLELLLDAEDQELEKNQSSQKYQIQEEGAKYNEEKQHKKQEGADESNKLDLKTLVSEYEELKGQTTCKVCLDEDATVVFLPCGHMCTCVNCAPAMRKCPICRSFVKGTVKAILS